MVSKTVHGYSYEQQTTSGRDERTPPDTSLAVLLVPGCYPSSLPHFIHKFHCTIQIQTIKNKCECNTLQQGVYFLFSSSSITVRRRCLDLLVILLPTPVTTRLCSCLELYSYSQRTVFILWAEYTFLNLQYVSLSTPLYQFQKGNML